MRRGVGAKTMRRSGTDSNAFRVSTSGAASRLFDVRRYADRSSELERLLATSQERYWNPQDNAYLDLSDPFDIDRASIMPPEWYPELRSAFAKRLDGPRQIRLGNEVLRWFLSGILHGEQAAVNVCAQLCTMFDDPAAQEFAASQARDEARHVAAFTRYIAARWGKPYPPGEAFGRFLCDVIASDDIAAKILGIGVLVEGFAMGAFANIHAHTKDRALSTLMRLLLRDEAVHHSCGMLWFETAVSTDSPTEVKRMADWALRGYRALRLNLVSIRQRRAAYETLGLDWREANDAVRRMRRDPSLPSVIEEDTNPLDVVARCLARSGILSPRQASGLRPRRTRGSELGGAVRYAQCMAGSDG